MIASGQSRKLAILQLNGGEGSRRWRVPGLKTGTGRDRSSPRLSICQGVLLMKTLEASAATDGVSLDDVPAVRHGAPHKFSKKPEYAYLHFKQNPCSFGYHKYKISSISSSK